MSLIIDSLNVSNFSKKLVSFFRTTMTQIMVNDFDIVSNF
jgi:hypothetical protein